MTDPATIAMVAGAALVAGAINAVAGGGSLITFPTLVYVGVPPVIASITNTVALVPGYLGATVAQRRDLVGQGKRAARLLPIGALGGLAGAVLLLESGESAFKAIVPFLLLFASLTVAVQERLRAWLLSGSHETRVEALAVFPIAFAAVYGGYFGAGVGVMILASLGVVIGENLMRINALKQAIALSINVSAAVLFIAWGKVDWSIALVMAGASLVGGAFGGVLSKHVAPAVLRWMVVVIGTGVSIIYFAKL